jgi:hypothetical protein
MKFLPHGEHSTCSLQKQTCEVFHSQLDLSVRRNKTYQKPARIMYWKAACGLRVAYLKPLSCTVNLHDYDACMYV